MGSSEKCYEDFYKVLEKATIDSVRQNMVLTISGGWDTRVIAGILASNKIFMPSVTCKSKLEQTIGSKVASVLGFKEHYVCDTKHLYPTLKNLGCQFLLTGACFDEINGAWTGCKAKTYREFKHAQKFGMTKRFRDHEALKRTAPPFWVTPILTKPVLEALNKIPWQRRIRKQIQRWILRNKFPKLWHIPYYDSLLPNFLPYLAHGLSANGFLFIRKGLRWRNCHLYSTPTSQEKRVENEVDKLIM